MKRPDAYQLAAYLCNSPTVQRYFPHAGSADMGLPPRPLAWSRPVTSPSVEQLAAELIAEEEFAGLWLGAWFGTPQGVVFEQAVRMILPPGYQADYNLLVTALKQAARQQNKKAAGIIFAMGLVGVVAVLLRGE